MNKYLVILVLFASLFLNSSKTSAQLCGHGTYTIEIYVPNGEKEVDINYELIPINQDALSKILLPDREMTYEKYHQYFGVEMYEENALRIMDTTVKQVVLPFDTQPKGKAEKGIITFRTAEIAYNTPYLLKLSSGKRSIYIMDCFFHGCNHKLGILWNENHNPEICGRCMQ